MVQTLEIKDPTMVSSLELNSMKVASSENVSRSLSVINEALFNVSLKISVNISWPKFVHKSGESPQIGYSLHNGLHYIISIVYVQIFVFESYSMILYLGWFYSKFPFVYLFFSSTCVFFIKFVLKWSEI